MSDNDDKILEALSAEDKEVMASYGKELGLFGLIAESFRGEIGSCDDCSFHHDVGFCRRSSL
jgi:hypothetical protein